MFVTIAPRRTAAWKQAAQAVRDRYALKYGATVQPSPDLFIIISAVQGSAIRAEDIAACAGMTFASERRFYPEYYLDAPLEDVLSKKCGGDVDREGIVEVSSLIGSGGVGLLLVWITNLLAWRYGMQYLIATMTERLLDRAKPLFSGFEWHLIGQADVNDLPSEQRTAWGSYYAQRPCVIVVPTGQFGRLTLPPVGQIDSFPLSEVRMLDQYRISAEPSTTVRGYAHAND
ncbi:thermostable hemolysin [Streptomyces sp. NPDC005122]